MRAAEASAQSVLVTAVPLLGIETNLFAFRVLATTYNNSKPQLTTAAEPHGFDVLTGLPDA